MFAAVKVLLSFSSSSSELDDENPRTGIKCASSSLSEYRFSSPLPRLFSGRSSCIATVVWWCSGAKNGCCSQAANSCTGHVDVAQVCGGSDSPAKAILAYDDADVVGFRCTLLRNMGFRERRLVRRECHHQHIFFFRFL